MWLSKSTLSIPPQIGTPTSLHNYKLTKIIKYKLFSPFLDDCQPWSKSTCVCSYSQFSWLHFQALAGAASDEEKLFCASIAGTKHSKCISDATQTNIFIFISYLHFALRSINHQSPRGIIEKPCTSVDFKGFLLDHITVTLFLYPNDNETSRGFYFLQHKNARYGFFATKLWLRKMAQKVLSRTDTDVTWGIPRGINPSFHDTSYHNDARQPTTRNDKNFVDFPLSFFCTSLLFGGLVQHQLATIKSYPAYRISLSDRLLPILLHHR